VNEMKNIVSLFDGISCHRVGHAFSFFEESLEIKSIPMTSNLPEERKK